jgi:redox-sensitive bicupin YhaK (pirin superfamily)
LEIIKMIEIRKSSERGYADHGWLQSFHSFSFADYHDPAHLNFGPLLVINEDRVAAHRGFDMHGHRDMEIITYVLEGELAHKDSMGNGSIIRPGDVQRMSAGTGVQHSEFNHAGGTTHFLQIWIMPNRLGVTPSYEEANFSSEQKRGRLRLVASPDGEQGSVRVHQDARLYAGLFNAEEAATLPIASGRRAYIQVARGAVSVNGVALGAGDAAKLVDEASVHLSSGQDAEVLVFDLP